MADSNLNDLAAVTTIEDADLFYSVRSSADKKLTGAHLKAACAAVSGDVIGPATNTADHIPQWDGADSKTLKDGLDVGTGANNLVQLDASSKLPAVDGSALTNIDVGDKRWTEVSSSKYTANIICASEITMSDTSDMYVGAPLRYTYVGTKFYGIVKEIVTDTKIVIAGATLDLAQDLTELMIGLPEMAVQVDFFISSTFADAADDDLLKTDMSASFDWNLSAARLVQLRVKVESEDTGANEPRANVSIGGDTNDVCTSNANAGLAVASTWQSTLVDISLTHYSIARDEKMEISTDANGSNNDAEDLSVSCVFVLE